MSINVYDYAGQRWKRIRGRYVNLCANTHGPALFDAIHDLAVGECRPMLAPVLGRWLDLRVLPDAVAKASVPDWSEQREDWATGLALFAYSPARNSGSESNQDRMTPDVCRSLPTLRKYLTIDDDKGSKKTFGQCLKHHFSDIKKKLVQSELNDLKLHIWWKIEQCLREVLADWEDTAHTENELERHRARRRLDSPDAIAAEVMKRLPPKLGITRPERVREYIETFDEPEHCIDIADITGLGESSGEAGELLITLQRALQTGDHAHGLSDAQRAALLREYIDGIPSGLSSAEFTRKYGVSRPTHNNLVKSGLPTLGRYLGHQLGAQR